MAKKKKKPKLPKVRSLVQRDMLARRTGAGRMRHRNDRRPKDARNDETRNNPSSTEAT
jgi:hypothetical protein